MVAVRAALKGAGFDVCERLFHGLEVPVDFVALTAAQKFFTAPAVGLTLCPHSTHTLVEGEDVWGRAAWRNSGTLSVWHPSSGAPRRGVLTPITPHTSDSEK